MTHTNESVIELCKKQRDYTKSGLSYQYDNTATCRAAYNGDVIEYRDQIQFVDTRGKKRRATVNFHKIQPNIEAVVGFMAQNRRQAKFIARVSKDMGQQLYSKNMNAIYTYHREVTNADQLETAQDADMVVNGYGAIDTDVTYIVGNASYSPSGDIVKQKIDPMRVGWDPDARDQNLTDRRWNFYFEDFSLQDALDLFQGSKEDDFEAVGDDSPSDRSGYQFNPYGGLYDKIKAMDCVEWTSKDEDKVRVYKHEWFQYEPFYRAMNPIYQVDDPQMAMYMKARLEMMQSDIKRYQPDGIDAGDLFDFDPTAMELVFDKETKAKLVKEFGNLIKPVEFRRKCFYTAVYSGEHCFTWYKSISQSGFALNFKTGVYNSQGKFWIGMVNAMIEPQRYYNKGLTEFMFTVASLSKGGVMVEEGAVEDISEIESKWARTDAVIRVNAGALSGGKIQEKARSAMPTGIDNIISLADANLAENGVDPAFMGEAAAQESGVLYKRRIRQAISKLARYFDAVTLYQKLDARLCIDLIRVWLQNNEGHMVRITGEDGAQDFMQIAEDMLAPQYDVSIQEAPVSPEDNEQMSAMISAGAQSIMQINPTAAQAWYAESVNLLPIDGEVKQRLTSALQPQETVPMQQYQQVVQQLQELQSQITQVNLAKTIAETEKLRAQTAKENAGAADTLEAAANKGLENDLIRSGSYDEVQVRI